MAPIKRWALAISLCVAAAIRLDNIGQPFIDPYAWREASVAMMAENFHHTSWNIFYPEVNWVGPGPGYQGREFQTVSYLAALGYSAFGHHDWIGRVVSAAFGLLGIFALFHLVRLVWDENRAIAAAVLLALFPGGAQIDRAFIPDAVMVALVLSSCWLFVKYLTTNRCRYLLIATIVGTLGNLTKLPGMIIGLPMLYSAVSILGRTGQLVPKRLMTLLTAAAVSVVPVVGYYLWARHLSYTYPPYHFSGEGNWLWDSGVRAWIEQGYFLSRLIPLMVSMWTLPVLFMVLMGLALRLIRNNERRREDSSFAAPWFFHWWILAGGVYYLIGALELVENGSNLHLLSPAMAALSADAIITLTCLCARTMARPRLWLPAAALIVAGIGFTAQHPARMREAYAHQSHLLGVALREVSQEGDLVVALGDLIGCPVAIYYSDRRGWLFPPFGQVTDWNKLPAEGESIRMFDELRAGGARWFGVVARRRDEIWKERPQFGEHIQRTSVLVRTTNDFVIYRLQRSVSTADVATR